MEHFAMVKKSYILETYSDIINCDHWTAGTTVTAISLLKIPEFRKIATKARYSLYQEQITGLFEFSELKRDTPSIWSLKLISLHILGCTFL